MTTAHANLEGMSNCTECHDIGNKVSSSKCLKCHETIQKLIDDNHGYHTSEDVKNKECFDCHSEHHGRNFQISRFDSKDFDHDKTSFTLRGKHTNLDCEKCHKKEFMPNPEISKVENTFLGLDQNCQSCHEDFHQGELNNNCASCHNENSFRPAPGFDHNKAKFVLTGSHKKTECNKCHKEVEKNGKLRQSFRVTSFNKCTTCHEDVHKNKFGQNCESCHSTETFRRVKNIRQFDHSKTNFKLIGKHNNVECNECHKTNYITKIAHNRCTDCHSDYHKGELTRNGTMQDCKVCHDEFGFTPSKFTIEKHNALPFLLTESHLAVSCESCHKTNNQWKFAFTSTRCVDCHSNIHGNSISAKFMGNNECKSCHNVSSWSDVSFEHDRTDFKLTGKHSNVQCRACHMKNIFNGKQLHLFSDLSDKCESCHNDKHFSQFEKTGSTDCSRCHTSDGWRIADFNHEKTLFPLDGKHKDLQCAKCHKETVTEKQNYILYKIESYKCADCHS